MVQPHAVGCAINVQVYLHTTSRTARLSTTQIPQLQVLALLKLHVVRVHALGQDVHVQVRLHAGEGEPLFQAMT